MLREKSTHGDLVILCPEKLRNYLCSISKTLPVPIPILCREELPEDTVIHETENIIDIDKSDCV